MWKYAEAFFLKAVFRHAVMIIKSGLRCPADMERGGHMRLGPFKNFSKLIPVIHFFKLQLLDRSSCNDHAVKTTVLHFFKGFVK